jgi:sigma-B regulation protein RsbU (phosphoserine phosphatase)
MSATTSPSLAPRLEPKLLYRRLDSLFGGVDKQLPQSGLVESFLEQAFLDLRDDLRLRAGLLYAERRDGFELQKRVGDPRGAVAELLDPALAPLQHTFRHRVYIFADASAPDSPHTAGWLPPAGAASVVVGRRPHRYVLFFVLDDGWLREELDFTLNTARAALGSRMVDERVRDSMKEAAEIQQSLLLEEPPEFPGYEIACRSIPAEEVGGDFYDFLSFGDEILGLSIGDASGHGLPAALLVRDVVTGLRMGIERNLKVASVFGKLNKVIHRSNLSSHFISLVYAELDKDGTLVYVNAGHPPPLVFCGERVEALAKGGSVIGPLPEAEFRRGIARLPPGGLLFMCTDGILERRDASGEFFGEERLQRLVRDAIQDGAERILERVFDAAARFGESRPWEDDATAVVVKRRAQ